MSALRVRTVVGTERVQVDLGFAFRAGTNVVTADFVLPGVLRGHGTVCFLWDGGNVVQLLDACHDAVNALRGMIETSEVEHAATLALYALDAVAYSGSPARSLQVVAA